MSINRLILRVLLGVFLISCLPWRTPTPAAARAWGDKSQPFGMIVSLGNRVRADEMPSMIALMQEAGVQWNREEISWDHVQFAPDGEFRWDGNDAGFYNYDRSIQLQRDAGINILGLLAYNPAWFKSRNPHPDEWLNDWGDYVYATVARYGRDRGQIKYWEVWNEPNLVTSGYESGLYTVSDYVEVLQTAQAAIKSADPQAKIVLGGVADIWSAVPTNAYDTIDYLQQLHDLGAWSMFDILGLHPYRPLAPEIPAWRRDHFETFRDQMDRIDALLAQFGEKPIWFTEMGWSSQADDHIDEWEQAAWMQRFYLLAMSRAGIEKIFWYDFRNDTGGNEHYTNPINDPNEEQFHYGLLNRTYPLDVSDVRIRKPAYSAYFQLTHGLGGLGMNGVYSNPFENNLGWQHWSGSHSLDILWWTQPEQAPPYIEINCFCKRARVRGFDGQVQRILTTDDGKLKVQPPQNGLPVWVEYGGDGVGGRRFEQTGHAIRGEFRTFWEQNGGLAQFGLPLTDELIEPSEGRIPVTVQYFERNRFELHPQNPPDYRVLLGLLGINRLQQRGTDWRTLPPANQPVPEGCTYFEQTGHALCYPFKDYWEQRGGVALFGYPITEAFWEYNPETNQGQLVQYFERNRFEHHPDLAGTAYEIQLGLLGQQLYGGWVYAP